MDDWLQELQQLFEEYEAALGGVTDPTASPEARRQHAAEAADLAEAVVIEAATAAAAADTSAARHGTAAQVGLAYSIVNCTPIAIDCHGVHANH